MTATSLDLTPEQLIRRAIFDPGQHVARGDNYSEPLPSWQARATLAALDANGLAVVAQSETERLRELLAEVDRLRAELAERVVLLGELGTELDERERLEALLDRFAAAVAPVEVIGEHSSGNDPWANALDMVTPAAEVDRLRQAVELLGSHLQGESQALIDAMTANALLREQLADRDQTIAGLMNDVDELRAAEKAGA